MITEVHVKYVSHKSDNRAHASDRETLPLILYIAIAFPIFEIWYIKSAAYDKFQFQVGKTRKRENIIS